MPTTPKEMIDALRDHGKGHRDALANLVAECVAAHWPLTADQRTVLDNALAVLAGNPFATHEPPLTAD